MSTTPKQTPASTPSDRPTHQDGSPQEPPAELVDQLVISADAPLLDELVKKAGSWLLAAFEDPERSLKLGSTFVTKLYLDGQKALAAKPPEETPEEADQRKSVLEQVDRLPKGHAVKLLKQEIARLEGLTELHRKKLSELQEG